MNIRELAFYNDSSGNKKLLAIDNLVYNIGPFLNRHPGGDTSLRIFLGRDCSEEFAFIHGSSPPKMILDSFLVGKIIEPVFNSTKDRECWYEFLKALDQLVELINLFNIETEVFTKECFRNDSTDWSPYKSNLFENLCNRVESYYLPYFKVQLQKFEIVESIESYFKEITELQGFNEISCNMFIALLKNFMNENLNRCALELKSLEQ